MGTLQKPSTMLAIQDLAHTYHVQADTISKEIVQYGTPCLRFTLDATLPSSLPSCLECLLFFFKPMGSSCNATLEFAAFMPNITNSYLPNLMAITPQTTQSVLLWRGKVGQRQIECFSI